MRHAVVTGQQLGDERHMFNLEPNSGAATHSSCPADNVACSYPQRSSADRRRGQHHVQKLRAPSTDDGLVEQ